AVRVGAVVALALEMLRNTRAVRERKRIVEHEIDVVVEIERDRPVVRAGNAHRLQPRVVENLILTVQRDGEQRARPPLEAARLAVGKPDHRRAGAGKHIKERFVEMPDWTRFSARGHFDHVVAHEVARAVRKGKAAARAIAVPWTCLQAEQVMAKVEMNRNAFALSPLTVGIKKKRLGCRQSI